MKKHDCSTCTYNRNFIADGRVVDTDCTNFHITDDEFIIFHTHGRQWYGGVNHGGCSGYVECDKRDTEVLL